MAERESLLKKRSVLKRNLTRFQNLVEIISKQPATADKERLQLPMRLENAKCLLEEFNEVQFQIEILQDNDDELEANETERNVFETGYYTYVSMANDILVKGDSDSPVFNVNIAHSTNSTKLNSIRLPVINLPIYEGDYRSWLEFRDTFLSLIHNNNEISNIQKFHYLRASLKGDASHVIQSLELCNSNYIVAWNALIDRYDNKRLIVHNHVKSLFNLPSLTKESHLLLRELLSAISKNLRALKTLGQPVEKWDTLIIFLITNKLDSISKREWESYKIEGDLPTLEEMKTFLKGKCELLETLSLTQLNNTNTLNKPKFQKPHNSTSNSFVATSANPNPIKEIFCVFCKQPHSIHHCEEFKQLPVSSRITEAKTKRLCINCLKPNHSSWHCKSTNCRSCGRKHHTLLHLNNQAANNLINNPQTNNSQNINLQEASSSTSTVNHALSAYNQQILLSTANIKVQDKFGNFHSCRALLDSGSQSNFITQDLCNLLGLKYTKINMTVTGINHATSNLTHKIDLNLKSIYDNYKSSISCIVTPQITGNIPSASFSASTLDIPKNIKLADNAFNISDKIDVLIGAQLFFDLICIGQVKLSNRKVTLQKTRLGWVLGGPLAFPVENKIETFCNLSVNDNLDVQNQLAKFWELEECPNIKVLSREEKFCESNYTSTTTRDEDGRFFVSIPLKDSITKLGDSKEIAIRRFHALERKLQGNLNLRQQYIAFMKEYEGLGHMTKILEPDNNPISYYLPHHG